MKAKYDLRRPVPAVLGAVLGLLTHALTIGRLSADSPDALRARTVARDLSLAFGEVAQRITPSLVSITTGVSTAPTAQASTKKGASSPKARATPVVPSLPGNNLPQLPEGFFPHGMGTGVVVDREGHIITNNHVVGEATLIKVRVFDGGIYEATLVGKDAKADLALLKINAKNIPAATLGNSDALSIGEWVVAAGSPFGLDNSITSGIVSAKGRSLMGNPELGDFIQTDAAINPGNSGGPLLNLDGEVVGINTAIFSRTGGYMGIGFAIPVNRVRTITAGFLGGASTPGPSSSGPGASGQLLPAIVQRTEGEVLLGITLNEQLVIVELEADGAATAVGMMQGDQLVEIDGGPVNSKTQLANELGSARLAQGVVLKVLRKGAAVQFRVRVH